MTIIRKLAAVAVAAAALATTLAAQADITVGVTLSATGPAASLGIPEKNTIELMPRTIAGHKVNYIVLDDASDTTAAVANVRRLVTESKVDVIIGSTTTPNSLAMLDVVAELADSHGVSRVVEDGRVCGWQGHADGPGPRVDVQRV